MNVAMETYAKQWNKERWGASANEVVRYGNKCARWTQLKDNIQPLGGLRKVQPMGFIKPWPGPAKATADWTRNAIHL